VIPNVCDLYTVSNGQRSLNVEIPGDHVGCFQVFVDTENVARCSVGICGIAVGHIGGSEDWSAVPICQGNGLG